MYDNSGDIKYTKPAKPIKTKWLKQQPKFRMKPVNTEKTKLSELSQLTAQLIQKSERELFEEFWDGEMFDLMVNQSTLYAQQQNRHEFNLQRSAEEISWVFAIFWLPSPTQRTDVLGKC